MRSPAPAVDEMRAPELSSLTFTIIIIIISSCAISCRSWLTDSGVDASSRLWGTNHRMGWGVGRELASYSRMKSA